MAKLVAKTYGEALFEIAMEENKTEIFIQEVDGIKAILEQNPEFDKLLKHPKISKQEKIEIVENVFKEKITNEMIGFLELIITKERYSELQNIFSYFIEKVKEEKKIGIAYITTASQVQDSWKEEVREKLIQTTHYETMELYFDIDSSLIGGAVIRIKDRVIDSSIKTKLSDLTKQLLQIQLG